jgi:hypothetical protein
MISHHRRLRAIRQIHPDDRVRGRQQPAQPDQPVVTVAISPAQAATVVHERPPRCVGYQARQPHQQDVTTSTTDA